jgi:excisionase family DNA binding protein
MSQEHSLLTVEEACQALRLSRATLQKHYLGGELPSLKIGRRRFIELDALERFIADHRSRNDEDPAGTGSLARTSAEDGGGRGPV